MDARSDARWVLRPATLDHADAIASVWHAAWRDGHVGHVPLELEQQRSLADFRSRVASHLPHTTVATIGGVVAGFVTVHDDELEELFLAESSRGTGLADALLGHGEAQIRRTSETAWLAVVTGNARARRFYERNGWSDTGPIEYQAESASGPVTIVSRRYEKDLG